MDIFAVFETSSQNNSSTASTTYAIRQALDQEYKKYLLRQRADARQTRYTSANNPVSIAGPGAGDREIANMDKDGVEMKPVAVNRDFFGRVVDKAPPTAKSSSSLGRDAELQNFQQNDKGKVWVSYHEGFSNAVRKPISLEELMRGF